MQTEQFKKERVTLAKYCATYNFFPFSKSLLGKICFQHADYFLCQKHILSGDGKGNVDVFLNYFIFPLHWAGLLETAFSL